MKALILGSSGMVGSEVLKECLGNQAINAVTVVNRDPGTVHDRRVTEIVHKDFTDFSSIKRKITGHDIVLYCIGVYQGAVPENVFARVTVDFLAALAKTVESEKTVFCLLSAGGANPDSAILFAKWKGRAEEALRKRRFKAIRIFRPGYIHPSDPLKRPKPFRYRVFSFLYPVLNLVARPFCVTSHQLAHAMVTVGVHGSDQTIFENRAIRRIA